jgi:hypothetical protein
MSPSPLPPFGDWPVQFFDAGLGFAWYCEPAALVFQTVVEHGSLEAVEALNNVIDRVLVARRAELRAAGGLLLFHDWRTLKGYDKEARELQFARMRARPTGYARLTVIVIMPANRLLRMAVETAGLISTVTFGSHVALATHPAASLFQFGIRPPKHGGDLLL